MKLATVETNSDLLAYRRYFDVLTELDKEFATEYPDASANRNIQRELRFVRKAISGLETLEKLEHRRAQGEIVSQGERIRSVKSYS